MKEFIGMAVLKILGLLLAFVFSYILFLIVCSLFVDSKKEYEKHSKLYRVLLNGATSIAIKIMRIRLHVNGIEKNRPIPKICCLSAITVPTLTLSSHGIS